MSSFHLLYVTLLCTVLCDLTLGNQRPPTVVACEFSRNIRNALSASSLLAQTTHCGEEKLSGSYIGDSNILLDKPQGANSVHRARLLAPVLGRFRDTLLRLANRQSSGELRECLESYQEEQSSLANMLSSFATEIEESMEAHAPLNPPSSETRTVEGRVTIALADYAERGISPLETVAVDPAYWRLVLLDMDVAMLELSRIGHLLASTCEE
ncbi:Hypp2242 [Branchiostoma lanceolatum]|uniref:Hypp2242 protein n=1 Tax=Branchiostoma lanceolatum TaxID=7740 RepID=A0A8K0ESG0_BRALA|nr:Hypp2242 [Branchiostoma lanceolatum]